MCHSNVITLFINKYNKGLQLNKNKKKHYIAVTNASSISLQTVGLLLVKPCHISTSIKYTMCGSGGFRVVGRHVGQAFVGVPKKNMSQFTSVLQ